MKFLLAVLIFAVCAVFAGPALAFNPFVSGKPQQDKPAAASENLRTEPGVRTLAGEVYEWSASMQRRLKARMTRLARDIRREPWGSACLAFFGLCFLYGAAHALGPGHGKSVVVAYLLGRPGGFWSGLALGWAIPIIHVSSAVVAVLIGTKVLSLAGMESLDVSEDYLMTASYAFLLLIGVALAALAVREMLKGATPAGEDGPADKGRMAAVAFATGAVPCPGAAIILVFSMSLGLLAQGLAAMVFLAAGMGVTTSAFAVGAVMSRRAALALSGGEGRLFVFVYSSLSLIGALAVAFFGGIMLLGRLGG
ncbi:MAG: nickel/cobalt transporter [Desulfovibrionaceae bacterium]